MSVLRQHTVLLNAALPVVGPSIGSVHQFTPSDGDTTTDAEQGFVALVVAQRQLLEEAILSLKGVKVNKPAISFLIEGSFDREHWVRLVALTMPPTDSKLDRSVAIGAVPPFLRTRVYATSLATYFKWTAHVAVGANAPYRARKVE